MFSGLKLCLTPATDAPTGHAMFPDIVKDISQELYCRRYAPLWHLAMSHPLTHAQYRTATDASEFDSRQVQHVFLYFFKAAFLQLFISALFSDSHMQLLQSSLDSFKGNEPERLFLQKFP
jgi:hypothetical protein